MKCVEAQRLMRAYAEGSLPDRETEVFLDHVEKCHDCYEELELYLLVQSTLDSSLSSVSAPAFSMERQIETTRNAIHRRKLRRMMIFLGALFAVIIGAGIFRMGLIRRMFKPVHKKPRVRTETVMTEPTQDGVNELVSELVTESISELLTAQMQESTRELPAGQVTESGIPTAAAEETGPE